MICIDFSCGLIPLPMQLHLKWPLLSNGDTKTAVMF